MIHWNDDRRDSAWCRRVSVDRCSRQVLRWHDAETAIAVVDTALTLGLLSTRELPCLAGIGGAVPEADLLRCVVGAQSGVESLARQRLQRIGLPLRLQPEIPGVGHVDIGIVGTMVSIEVDGYEYHRDRGVSLPTALIRPIFLPWRRRLLPSERAQNCSTAPKCSAALN